MSSADTYEYIFPHIKPSPISLAVGDRGVTLGLKELVWKYLSTKRNCKHYSSEDPEGDSYTQCKLKKIIECAVNTEHQNKSCNCTPEGRYKSYFQLYPTLSFGNNSCITDKVFSPFHGNPNRTINENTFCNNVMKICYRKLRSSCPISCEKIEYTVQKRDNQVTNANQVDVKVQFASTDIAIHNEVLIQELGNFIGTVGGSLGLFIGFSYTGFVGQLIDYFM